MHRLILIGFVLALGLGAARAEWQNETGEDPMTDKKWAAAFTALDESGWPNVGFKCWRGGPLQLAILVGPYDHSAVYADPVEAKLRIDKDEPVTLALQATDLNGTLMLRQTSEGHPELLPLLKRVGEAKQRFGLAVGQSVFQADARGNAKAIALLLDTCDLK